MLQNIKRKIVYDELFKTNLEVAVFKKKTKEIAENVLALLQKGIFQNTYGQIVAKSLN